MISPVFDVAQLLLVVDSEAGSEVRRREVPMHETNIGARAMHVARLGVDVLICGAISRPLEMVIVSEGIKVIPYACGSVEDVLRAYVSEQLTDRAYLMPGCRGCRRRIRARGGRGFGRQRGMP